MVESMIEKMIFVRHGDYNNNSGGLTVVGEASIRALAPKVVAAFAGAPSILALSAPALRATQTAKILCDALGIERFQEHRELEAEYYYSFVEELEKTREAFLRIVGDAKYVLVSAHQPVAKFFPWWFAKQMLGVNLPGVRCDKADAIYLDCIAKTLTLL
jgi:phosphohistidine phosphatase SixA